MHVTVTDGCISCGLCADEFPELFHLNDEGVAVPWASSCSPRDRSPRTALFKKTVRGLFLSVLT